MADAIIELLLRGLDEAYHRASWHGPNLRGALRQVTAEQAAVRMRPDRHNIWELTVHSAYWKYAAWRQMTGSDKGTFPLKGSNFFPRNGGTEKEWKADLALLEQQHRLLRSAVAELMPSDLDRHPGNSKYTVERIVRGVAAHDLYHAGQIQLLKRML